MKQTKRILFIGVLCMVMVFCAACGGTEPADSSLPTVTTTTTISTAVVTDEFSFIATVTEAGEDFLLVEAEEGSTIAGTVRVLLQQPASVTAGDRILVRHTGQMMPSLPPQIVATDIEKIG